MSSLHKIIKAFTANMAVDNIVPVNNFSDLCVGMFIDFCLVMLQVVDMFDSEKESDTKQTKDKRFQDMLEMMQQVRIYDRTGKYVALRS